MREQYEVSVGGFKLWDNIYYAKQSRKNISGNCLVCRGSGKLHNDNGDSFDCFHCMGKGELNSSISFYTVESGCVVHINLDVQSDITFVDESCGPAIPFDRVHKTYEEAKSFCDELNKEEEAKWDRYRMNQRD